MDVNEFVNQHCIIGKGAVPCAGLYQAYKQWCKKAGTTPAAYIGFDRHVRALMPRDDKAMHNIGGMQLMCFEGICLK